MADLTGRNPNVFYELAVRHTVRRPVALISEESEKEKLPFDIAQMRTIFFNHHDLESADRCREAIVSHLRSAFSGAVESPIATTVDLKNLQAGSTVERSLAQLVTRVEDLGPMLARLGDLQADTFERLLMERHMERRIAPEAAADLMTALDRIRRLAKQHKDRELEDLLRQAFGPARYIADSMMVEFGRPRRGPTRGEPESPSKTGASSVPDDEVRS